MVSNLVSGIIILLDKSIKPGDVISIGETFGWINAQVYDTSVWLHAMVKIT
ncbi:mechanosensitive ion channel domain-containing protein [Planktotalea sp.]|uniref:mechanosensitive ion channel domain-containing protein n=1 Tax=Planktotalea sp. TaxID=2029877 RepID=UPI00342FFAB7